jgi:phosphoenolpyruvate carboxykinase (diphosphate)
VLSGRRNNPPDPEAGFRSLAVYSPLHYQELPELVMDYVCSLTGKSPSTTGAGSEGALTKGPFNALNPSIDMNSTIVSMILTGLGGFSTPAGHIGSRFEVGHDISILIPEVWCRMGPEERDPQALIRNGMLEKIHDFEHNGVHIPASRLGYRITEKFVRAYLARIFDNPGKVFTKEILKPELQDPDSFADGILHITEAQQRVAQRYMEDGSYELACPPLQALLSIMATGDYEGKTVNDPEIREMFTRDALIASDWYRRRLRHKKQRDIEHWRAFEQRLSSHMNERYHLVNEDELGIAERLAYAKSMRARAESPGYEDEIVGTLGADPMQPSLLSKSMIQKLAQV